MFSGGKQRTDSSLFAIFMLGMWLISAPLQAAEVATEELPPVKITTATNLEADAGLAASKQAPLLLFFSMKHCPYCREVEEDFLKPMLRSGEYENKVVIRKVKLDGVDSVISFDGREMDIEDFQDQYNVSMVPTLILVDKNGRQIAPEIVGIANPYYYSAELDNLIDKVLNKLRALASN